MTNLTSETPDSPKLPSHIAFHVRDRKGQRAFFNRIGVAYGHADGRGFTLWLDSMPIDGRITLRVVADK